MASPRRRLQVIALVSGGKDSFFSLLHCLINEHQIVALANLYPPGNSTHDDTNSFMYQTVGHTMVPLYSGALGLPLYRQEIIGTARDISKHYGSGFSVDCIEMTRDVDGDETECLAPLLRLIMSAHPETNALCSGAILSTYQRTRVEAVALRLGLLPLSYLWKYPLLPPPSPGGLLDDMAAVGLEVRIVKVSSGGLDDSLLWRNLMSSDVRGKVEKMVDRFGGSVLGEGGEYETLVLNGPRGIWIRRIEVEEEQIHRHVEYGSGGAAWIAIESGSEKLIANNSSGDGNGWRQKLKRIGLWDQEFRLLLERLLCGSPKSWIVDASAVQRADQDMELLGWFPNITQGKSKRMLNLSNLVASSLGLGPSEQMLSIFEDLDTVLQENRRSTRDVVFATIMLRSMADFGAVNQVYTPKFKVNPPARVTIATSLPPKVHVMVSFVISLDPIEARDCLHVQSRSYWAPANIGPYSQATSIHINESSSSSLVFVAGQIPLVPATMEVLHFEDIGPSDTDTKKTLELFCSHSALSLQHIWRIGIEMRVAWWTGVIAFISGESNIETKVMIARQAWENLHDRGLWDQDKEDDEELDAWDIKYGGLGNFANPRQTDQPLPDFSMVSDSKTPGFFAIQVEELPRGCEIEWQSLGVATAEAALITKSREGADSRSLVMLEANYMVSFLSVHHPSTTKAIDDTLEWARASDSTFMTIYTATPALFVRCNAQIIPCRAVWGPQGSEMAAGIVLHLQDSKLKE